MVFESASGYEKKFSEYDLRCRTLLYCLSALSKAQKTSNSLVEVATVQLNSLDKKISHRPNFTFVSKSQKVSKKTGLEAGMEKLSAASAAHEYLRGEGKSRYVYIQRENPTNFSKVRSQSSFLGHQMKAQI